MDSISTSSSETGRRSAKTRYDSLRGGGWDRQAARSHVSDDVERVLQRWSQASVGPLAL